MSASDDLEVLRKEIRALLSTVRERGTLLFVQWLINRITNDDALPPDEELKTLHRAFVRVDAAFTRKKPPTAEDIELVCKWTASDETRLCRAFGKAVRFFRQEKRISRLTLSKRCRVSLRFILRLERGRGFDFSVPALIRLAEALGVELGQFTDKVAEFEKKK